jgi:hypothetical protein
MQKEQVRIVGVFVGEWVDGDVYAIYHGSRGWEYLAKADSDRNWSLVSVRDPDGNEVEMEAPTPAPDPIVVAQSLLRGDDDLTLALDEWRRDEEGDSA